MGILSSFNVGVTGLRASGESMNVIGDNIANAGTHGFKKSRAEFQDILSSSLKGIDGGDQIGSGTKLAHVTPQYTQGSINRTDNVTDLAINGAGFFKVNAPWGSGYTRDGAFHFDKEGNLVNGDGFAVVGYLSNEDGQVSNKQGPIKLGNTTIPAKATTQLKISMNLDSRAEIQQFNPLDPEKTSSYNTSFAVYDNVGTQRLVTVYFNKMANNQWSYHALVDGAETNGGVPGTPVEMANGTLSFTDKGVLQQVTPGQNAFNFNKGAAPNQQIAFDFGKSIADGTDGKESTITQFGSDSSVARHTQDGHTAGTLGSMSFNDDGVLTASYDNGEIRALGQIAVAKFENNEGLFKTGRNLYKETRKSGQAAMGKPGHDGRGDVLAKSIELSNVDIADEFVDLMHAQRNFQANTRTITTSDQMLQEVLNIKR